MNLSTLKLALEPLKKFGQKELSFEVDSDGAPLKVSLRPLLPREEVLCQSKAGAILRQARADGQVDEEDNIERGVALSYFDAFRIEVVAFSVCAIGEHDFRGLKTIETGEVLDNGTPVRVPLQKALRDLIAEGWSRGMITICFSKYGDLVASIATEADKIVETSVADIDLEIERLASRIKSLEAQKEGRAQGDPSIANEHIKSLVTLGETFEKDVKRTVDQVRHDREVSEEIKRAEKERDRELSEEPPPRKSVIPKSAPPPTPVSEKPELDRVKAAQKGAADSSKARLGGVSEATVERTTIGGNDIEAYRMPSQTLSSRGTDSDKPSEPQGSKSRNPNFKPQG